MNLLADALRLNLGFVDYTILVIYFAFVIGIGFLLKSTVKTGEDFLTSGRSTAAWVAGLAFLSANLGAQELIGMGASGAKYGLMTAQFSGASSGGGRWAVERLLYLGVAELEHQQ